MPKGPFAAPATSVRAARAHHGRRTAASRRGVVAAGHSGIFAIIARRISDRYRPLCFGYLPIAERRRDQPGGRHLQARRRRHRAYPARVLLVCFIVQADHPLAGSMQPRWSDLAGVPLIALRRGNGIREQLERGYAAAGLDAEPAFELDQLTTIVAMVEAGFGITVLPLYAN